MKNITLDDLLKIITKYNPEEEEKVRKAYEYARVLHEGQFR